MSPGVQIIYLLNGPTWVSPPFLKEQAETLNSCAVLLLAQIIGAVIIQ
jgi:hypothetical protein